MPPAPYERVVVERAADSEDDSDGQGSAFVLMTVPRGQRWPKSIGVAQMIVGFLLSFLGLLEVMIIPISDVHMGSLQFNRQTCYGAGLWAGFVMVLTGATAVRASLSKRKTTVFRFYNLTILTLVVYTGLTIFLLTAYCLGWTTKDAYDAGTRLHVIHMFVTIVMLMGLILALSAFLQYGRAICCDHELWLPWLWCLCFFCWFRRLRSLEPALLTSVMTSDPDLDPDSVAGGRGGSREREEQGVGATYWSVQ